MAPKKKAAATTEDKPSRNSGIEVAKSIRKSMDEWHALVDAARANETRRGGGAKAPMAYEGHDHPE